MIGKENEVGIGMGAGGAGKETEKLSVSGQTIEKGQHKIEMQRIKLRLTHNTIYKPKD